jgi:hypothetical protein
MILYVVHLTLYTRVTAVQRWQMYLTVQEIRRGERKSTGVLDMIQGSWYLVLYFRLLGMMQTDRQTDKHAIVMLLLCCDVLFLISF